LGFSVVENRQLLAEGCVNVDAAFCASLKKRDSWDWKGPDAKKLQSLREVQEKIASCQSLTQQLASSAGNSWQEKSAHDAYETNAQVHDFLELVTKTYFPVKALIPMEQAKNALGTKERSPLWKAAQALEQLQDAVRICDRQGSRMIDPSAEQGKSAEESPAPAPSARSAH
jgi:hypothetical protein